MLKNKKLKIIIPACFAIIILIIMVLLLTRKPKMIQVTTVKSPYSTLSDINETDSLIIKLFVNQTNSYFTDIDKVSSCFITSDNNLYKLKLNSISYGNEETSLYNQTYYLFYYNFAYDFKFLSSYNDYLDKAILNMEFTNGINSSIEIGSLSITKYVNEETNLISDIAITQTKTCTSFTNKSNGFYGIILGIRNFNTEKEIKIKNIEIIDKSIKQIDNLKELDSINGDISKLYPNYPTINDYPSSIIIDKKSVNYISIPIVQDNTNDIDTGSFGLKINYEIIENGVTITKEYYFRKFVFYDYYYKVSEDSLIFYEYEFK